MNVAFCDGRVMWVSEKIDYYVYCLLMSTNGQRVREPGSNKVIPGFDVEIKDEWLRRQRYTSSPARRALEGVERGHPRWRVELLLTRNVVQDDCSSQQQSRPTSEWLEGRRFKFRQSPGIADQVTDRFSAAGGGGGSGFMADRWARLDAAGICTCGPLFSSGAEFTLPAK